VTSRLALACILLLNCEAPGLTVDAPDAAPVARQMCGIVGTLGPDQGDLICSDAGPVCEEEDEVIHCACANGRQGYQSCKGGRIGTCNCN